MHTTDFAQCFSNWWLRVTRHWRSQWHTWSIAGSVSVTAAEVGYQARRARRFRRICR